MIRLTILDPSLNIALPAADLTISGTDHYVSGYVRIVKAIHARRDLRVVVIRQTDWEMACRPPKEIW